MTTLSQPGAQLYDDGVQLYSSTAITATGSGTVEALFPGSISGVVLTCTIASAGSSSGDKLDMYVQTMLDGSSWLDVCHFTQITGVSTGICMVDKIHRDGAVTAFATTDTLAADAQRDIVGSKWRARWVITSSTDPTFSASVYAQPM